MKKKICHIISGDLWAGAEVQVYTQLKELQKIPDLELHVIILNPGKLAVELNKLNIDCLVFDESKQNFAYIFKQANKFINNNSIQALHSHRYKENILASLLKVNNFKLSLFQTIHGLPEPFTGFKGIKNKFITFINLCFTNLFFKKAICVSNETQRSLPIRKNISCVLHNGIDEAHILAMSNMAISPIFPNDKIIIGTLARLTAVKNISFLLKIFADIHKEYPNIHLCIIGDGPEKISLEKLSNDLKLNNYISFLGFKENPYPYIKQFNIFMLTSLHEGIPMSILEAGILELPVIASNAGGIKEIIDRPNLGLLFEVNNHNECIQNLRQYLDNSITRIEHAKNLKEQIRAKFSIENQSKRLNNIYQYNN